MLSASSHVLPPRRPDPRAAIVTIRRRYGGHTSRSRRTDTQARHGVTTRAIARVAVLRPAAIRGVASPAPWWSRCVESHRRAMATTGYRPPDVGLAVVAEGRRRFNPVSPSRKGSGAPRPGPWHFRPHPAGADVERCRVALPAVRPGEHAATLTARSPIGAPFSVSYPSRFQPRVDEAPLTDGCDRVAPAGRRWG